MQLPIRALACLLMAAPALGQITEWTVEPVPKGQALRWNPAHQLEILATWPDGTPRLVERLKGRGGLHPDISKLWAGGFRLRSHPSGGELDLRKNIRGIPKRGPLRLTTEHRTAMTADGSFSWWLTFDAQEPLVFVEMVWTAGAADLLFERIEVELPPGWEWTPDYHDPARGGPNLVRHRAGGGSWILPRRMSRPFLFVIHPAGVTPRTYTEKHRPADWSSGGYLQRDARIGTMPTAAWVGREYNREQAKLDALEHVWGGAAGQVPSRLMPAGGCRYGGMTGGYHRVDLPHAAVALSGGRAGLGLIWIELLRYRTRMVDWEALDGQGLPSGAKLPREGSGAGVPIDASRIQAAEAVGARGQLESIAAWDPIDGQHLDRMFRATAPGWWIFGRPIFRHYLIHDAYKMRAPANVNMGGRGSQQGREGANAVDILTAAYAVTQGPARVRFRDALERFERHWRTALVPAGTPLISRGGVVVTRKPLGRGGGVKLCHGFRGEEHNKVLSAAYGLHRSTDIDATGLLLPMLRFSTEYAWRPGAGAPWGKYPLELLDGTPITDPATWPTVLPEVWRLMQEQDAYQGYSFTASFRIGNHFGYAERLGVDWTAQVLEHTRRPDLAAAAQWVIGLGPDDLDRYGDTLAWLQAQPAPLPR